VSLVGEYNKLLTELLPLYPREEAIYAAAYVLALHHEQDADSAKISALEAVRWHRKPVQ